MRLLEVILIASLLVPLVLLLRSTRQSAWGILAGLLLGFAIAYPKSAWLMSEGRWNTAIFGLVFITAWFSVIGGSFVAMLSGKRIGAALLMIWIAVTALFFLLTPQVY